MIVVGMWYCRHCFEVAFFVRLLFRGLIGSRMGERKWQSRCHSWQCFMLLIVVTIPGTQRCRFDAFDELNYCI